MFKFDILHIDEAIDCIGDSARLLMRGVQERISLGAFTTSPALGSVAGQYTSYLGAHPGSLAVATKAVISNIDFLHSSLTQLVDALQCQEECSARSFSSGASQLPSEYGNYTMPIRPHIPIVDLGYLPPLAAVEAGTPLKALTAMFAGDDGQILAAADTWRSAAKRITGAVESLQRAASILSTTAEGAAFETAVTVINDTIAQATVIAGNATTMGVAMTRLPPIRAVAHAALLQMEAEETARKTAIAAASVANPAGATAALVAAEAQTQAQVAAFVSSHLQPALDTARPLVSNLGIEISGHHGGAVMATGAGSANALGQFATQVAGGAAAPGHTATVSQHTQTAQQVGQVVNNTGHAAHAAQWGQAVTTPAGGSGLVTGVTPGGLHPGQSPAGIAGGAPSLGRGPSTGTPDMAQPGIQPRAGMAMRTGPGSVAQPLLPRGAMTSLGRGSAGAMGYSGGTPGGQGNGASAGSSTPGRGAAVGTPGAVNGLAPALGGITRGTVGTGAGIAPMGGAGIVPNSASGRSPAGTAVSPFTATSGRGLLKKDLVKEYFRRQFLGPAPKTVKTIIR